MTRRAFVYRPREASTLASLGPPFASRPSAVVAKSADRRSYSIGPPVSSPFNIKFLRSSQLQGSTYYILLSSVCLPQWPVLKLEVVHGDRRCAEDPATRVRRQDQ